MNDYLTIPEWVLDLELPATLRDCYAVVLRFSGPQGEGAFYGSVAYLARWMGVSPDTARRALHKLVDRGLITRQDQPGKVAIYQITDPSQFARGDNMQGVAICKGSTRNLQGVQVGITSIPSINISYNRDIRESISPARPREKSFSFRQALIDAGVTADVADAWIAVRKTKRATNTKVAFEGAMREIEKSGASADDCIRAAVEQSWSGFRADWYARLQTPLTPTAPAPSRYETVEEHNRRVLEATRRRIAERYGPKNDEKEGER